MRLEIDGRQLWQFIPRTRLDHLVNCAWLGHLIERGERIDNVDEEFALMKRFLVSIGLGSWRPPLCPPEIALFADFILSGLSREAWRSQMLPRVESGWVGFWPKGEGPEYLLDSALALATT